MRFMWSGSRIWPCCAGLWLATTMACTGLVGSPSSAGHGTRDAGGGGANPGGAGGQEQAALAGAPARVRRLSSYELRNSVSDVFGTPPFDDIKFPVEGEDGQFENQFQTLTVTQDFADALQQLAEAAGVYVARWWAKLVPCDLPSQGESACADRFIDTLGRRAYRRPLRSALGVPDETFGVDPGRGPLPGFLL